MSNRLRSALLLRLATGLCLVLAPGRAAACSCESPPSAIAALLRSEAVFEGVVLDIAREEYEAQGTAFEVIREQVRVKIKVLRAWKGVSSAEMTVVTDSGGASCGFPFEVGGRYLVYAAHFRGKLTTNICSGTAWAATAHGEFRDLGPARWQGSP